MMVMNIRDSIRNMEFYEGKKLKAQERCEGSIHQYLDELVPNKGGVLPEPQSKDPISVDMSSYPPLAPGQYP